MFLFPYLTEWQSRDGKPLVVVQAKKSTRDAAIGPEQAKQYNVQVMGTGTGTSYIMIDVYDSKNKFLTHASVRVTVQNGVKANGNSARQYGVF